MVKPNAKQRIFFQFTQINQLIFVSPLEILKLQRLEGWLSSIATGKGIPPVAVPAIIVHSEQIFTMRGSLCDDVLHRSEVMTKI